MIKSLRRKFITAAMLSLLILIVILIGGITLLGYYQMERSADMILHSLTGERMPPEYGNRPPYPAFGYRIPSKLRPTGYFVAFVRDGKILSIEHMGMAEITQDDSKQYVNDVLEKESMDGKIGSYKYIIVEEENSVLRIVFLDISIQVQTLLNTMTISLLVGLVCMVLMLVILFFVSGRVIRPLAQNIQKQRQFVSNAGHEIKTPLGIIMANTDAMDLHIGENKWSRNIRGQTERMNGLMNLLLLLARMDEGADAIPMEPVNLSNIVKKRSIDFLELAKNKKIQIQATVADNIIIHGNPDNLEQLMSILLDNAVKYANAGGEISILLTADDRKCKLVVENSTEMIPDVPPDALFDRFYRANEARTQKDGGYGIGLSAARAIAQMHGGKIDAFYLEECIIRFVVELP